MALRQAQDERGMAMPMVAPVRQLEASLRNSPAGAQLIYAIAPDLPREEEAVKLARQWAEAGRGRLHQVRDPDDATRWRFMIVKGEDAGMEQAIAMSASGGGSGGPRGEMGALMELLRGCALKGQACPSNRGIARALDLPTRHRAKYLVARLQAEGAIRVENRGRDLPRIVTILAAGSARGRQTGDK